MKDMETIVSENIKKLLREYNLRQNELAKIAGVSESTVGKWVLKKAAPRMGAIQKMADHFNLPKSYILEEETNNIVKESESQYTVYPTTISAGLPDNVDGITNTESITLPNAVMGKWTGSNVVIMRVNGESMNKVIPHNSLIAVKTIELASLKDNDIVVFSNDNDYSVKRFYNDKGNERFVFSPESSERAFIDYTVPYSQSINLKIHGKVVVYIVELD